MGGGLTEFSSLERRVSRLLERVDELADRMDALERAQGRTTEIALEARDAARSVQKDMARLTRRTMVR